MIMKKISAQAALSLTLAANLSFMSAASPAIGVALTSGNIRINDAKAEGNASIFEGSLVETSVTGSRLQLKNGADVQLSSESKGKIYQNRLVLEKGNTQVRSSAPFEVDTAVVKVSGADRTSAQISLHGQTVQVASLTGTLKVVNASGVLLTTIAPGMSFDFTNADAGASGPQPPATDPNSQTNPSGKKKSPAAAAAGGASPHAHAWIIGGVLITAGTVGLASYWATQGVTSPQSCLSPCQTH